MHAVFQLADCCLRKPGSQCEAGKLYLFYLEGIFRKNYSILPTSWGRLVARLDKGGGLLCHGSAVSNKRATKIERSRRASMKIFCCIQIKQGEPVGQWFGDMNVIESFLKEHDISLDILKELKENNKPVLWGEGNSFYILAIWK